ncbi:MAG: HAMP domain-containing protein [Deltaproteobacteria bacterium]|nr:HAMP domain-containing protein [Deltaproteobacteria bacterium]
MKIKWKLKERLTVFSLCVGLIPLILSIIYVGATSSAIIKKQAIQYLQAKVDDFAKMAEIRRAGIEGNLDAIKIELEKSLKADLLKEASKEKYFETGYLLIVQPDGTVLNHPNQKFTNNKVLYDTYDWARNAVNKKHGLFEYQLGGDKKVSYLAYVESLDWILWGGVPEHEILTDVNTMKIRMYIFIAVISLIVAFLGIFISTRIANRAKEISEKMDTIAQGEADLTGRLPISSTDEIGDIAQGFNRFVANLEEVITQVKDTAAHVDIATQEVSAGSQGLSQATQEQASAIEEVAATIEEMTSSIKQNASNASDGRGKANDMVHTANASGEAAQELIRSMSEISEASKKIGNITTTVNEVAFQTNLLALNAAVEAARAGEHGKGFAVVAEEVRALAQRSAEAARQIKTLIDDTVNKIDAGDIMVKKSGESLEQIISQIQNLSLVMEEIAAASNEQATGVDELNRAIGQIDMTTQQNASTVEELASTSDNLSNEARGLADTVERFKVSQIQKNRRAVRKMHPKQFAPVKPRGEVKNTSSVDDDDFEEF